jgi:hypothetical protein
MLDFALLAGKNIPKTAAFSLGKQVPKTAAFNSGIPIGNAIQSKSYPTSVLPSFELPQINLTNPFKETAESFVEAGDTFNKTLIIIALIAGFMILSK